MLGVTRSTRCTHNLVMRQKNNNQKAAQETQQLPWVQETFIRSFPTTGWQAGWHFLKVHKHTSWLLVSPKENWKKKTPIKKNNNKQKFISFSRLFLPADWGFLSRWFILLWLRVHLLLIFPFQRNDYEEFRRYCSKSKQHAKPQRQFLLTLCPTSPFKTDDFPTFGWPRMKETLVSV